MKLIGPLVLLLTLILLVEGESQADDIIGRMANISITDWMDTNVTDRAGVDVTVMAVVASFATTCPDFFIKDNNQKAITPTVLTDPNPDRYKQICQQYKNNQASYRYATLYDTNNRIPVYSAYVYTGYQQTDRKGSWMIEPQLDNPGGKKTDMASESKSGVPLDQLGANQAVNCDYENTEYQKGHLYPHCHNCNQDQAESTFTLTNAAPQTGNDNIQWYNQVEKKISGSINKHCSISTSNTHVVTGVVPGNIMINTQVVKNRVNIPSHYWSAYCCQDQNNVLVSEGYLMNMLGNGKGRVVMYKDGTNTPFQQFNVDLKNLYNTNFEVFGNLKGCS